MGWSKWQATFAEIKILKELSESKPRKRLFPFTNRGLNPSMKPGPSAILGLDLSFKEKSRPRFWREFKDMENFEVLILKPTSGRCGSDEHLFCLTHAQACHVFEKTEFYLYMKDTTGRSSIFLVT